MKRLRPTATRWFKQGPLRVRLGTETSGSLRFLFGVDFDPSDRVWFAVITMTILDLFRRSIFSALERVKQFVQCDFAV